jgi:hypothetical protein
VLILLVEELAMPEQGDRGGMSPQEWGELVTSVLSNKLVRTLLEVDADVLSRADIVAILEGELRDFLALKAKANSKQPEAIVLRQAHLKLTELIQRSFMVTQLVLLDRPTVEGKKEQDSKNEPLIQMQGEPITKYLLKWHATRMNDIGLQFVSALVEVAQEQGDVYKQLDLPAEIESRLKAVGYRHA